MENYCRRIGVVHIYIYIFIFSLAPQATRRDPTQSRFVMASYIKILKTRLIHAPVVPTSLETGRKIEKMHKDDCMELELIKTLF